MDAHPFKICPSCSRHQLFFICCTLLDFFALLRDQLSCLNRCSTRCIFLLIMVQFDDFHIWEILGRLCCKLHQEHSPDSKVRSNQAPQALLTRKVCQFLNLLRCKASCPYNRSKAIFNCKASILVSNLWHGKVHPNICFKTYDIFFAVKDGDPCNLCLISKWIDQAS